MESRAEFQPSQILYIEQDTTRLYAELVQVVTERALCWVRPLALLTILEHLEYGHSELEQSELEHPKLEHPKLEQSGIHSDPFYLHDKSQDDRRPELAISAKSLDSSDSYRTHASSLPLPSLRWVDLQQFTLHDLRQGADLLAPKALFHFALDTEVMAMLVQLNAGKPRSPHPDAPHSDDQYAHLHLQRFIHHVWQTHPELFRSCP